MSRQKKKFMFNKTFIFHGNFSSLLGLDYTPTVPICA